ncbi:arginase family protein [Saccharopolyspora pogona]|uniref:arginase family protein n=1 Tax=Saccharopolyspora pogona TaxID=333966 RepID=UPI0016824D3E|nr:arginase family protein [Saccharopolyspora pogona]
MAIVSVLYHPGERLPEPGLPLPPDLTAMELPLPHGDVWQRLGVLYPAVADEVARAVDRGEVPTVVSGDCIVSLAVLAGLQRLGTEVPIVWFDAQGDVQTLETTESGYVGGMPVRIAVGYRPELIADRLGLRPLPESRALLVDIPMSTTAKPDHECWLTCWRRATRRASRSAGTATISSGATNDARPSPVILETDRRTSRSRKCHTAMP